VADIAHAENLQEPDELENALAVIRKKAENEAVAGRIFDSVLNEIVKRHHRTVFWGDRLLTIDKSAGFRNKPGFQDCWRKSTRTKAAINTHRPTGCRGVCTR
jgi:hypothetical protein